MSAALVRRRQRRHYYYRCRHCGQSCTRPSQLCRDCYHTTTSNMNRVGLGVDPQRVTEPAEPVRWMPGSEEKILAMQKRLENCEGLFHPRDGWEEET